MVTLGIYAIASAGSSGSESNGVSSADGLRNQRHGFEFYEHILSLGDGLPVANGPLCGDGLLQWPKGRFTLDMVERLFFVQCPDHSPKTFGCSRNETACPTSRTALIECGVPLPDAGTSLHANGELRGVAKGADEIEVGAQFYSGRRRSDLTCVHNHHCRQLPALSRAPGNPSARPTRLCAPP